MVKEKLKSMLPIVILIVCRDTMFLEILPVNIELAKKKQGAFMFNTQFEK